MSEGQPETMLDQERWTLLGQALATLVLPKTAAKPPPPATPDATAAGERICERCGDRGFYQDTAAQHPAHPHFGRLFPCPCQNTARRQRRAAALQRLSNLVAFAEQTFAIFDATIPGVEDAALLAQDYAARPWGWLVLFGGYGCGKTHLAAAIGNAVLARGAQVVFVTVPDLLDHLRATFAPGSPVSYDAQFDLVRSVPLLLLDDLGTEQATAWAREKLFQIINHRYQQHLPTVITSNQPFETIEGRIRSRISDHQLGPGVITITAQDYRQRPLPDRWHMVQANTVEAAR